MNNSTKQRYHILDSLRGFVILSMIIYHAVFNLVFFYNVNIPWFDSGIGYLWQQSICWVFIFLAGVCWSLDSKPLKRGIIIFFWGLVITFVTIIFIPEATVIFGILSFLGCAILMMIPLSWVLKKIEPMLGFIISFLLFIVVKEVNLWPTTLGNWQSTELSLSFFTDKILAFLGFPVDNFVSMDFFPIFPWIFLFIAGFYCWQVIKDGDVLFSLSRHRFPLLEKVGQHSLVIYLLHQPLIFGVLYLISLV